MQKYIFLGFILLLMIASINAQENKDYNKPLIMAHKGGDIFAKENSLDAINKSLEYNPDIVEIDIRKSKDNILFAYHGNALEYLFPKFYFDKNFDTLKENYPTLTTLNEIAKTVSNKSILFLHINDKSIDTNDLINSLKDIHYKEIWVANFDLDYLNSLTLPKDWKKINNGTITFFAFKKQKVLDSNINAIELSFWDFTEKNIKLLRDNNIDVALSHTLLTNNYYLKKAKDNNALWIYDYNFARLKN
jgi:hypothetical protein